ncbi:hypothetical protein I5I81_01750 [Pseudomonas aeruginosa]|nr:hypothetical protein [Pseudomonas aeruginosa]MBG6741532.1 hypothetical protein [Pseudomonas aeruginosa]MBG6858464.1 hypothetical protein [Pseudomonas aeruginosa]
MNPKPNTYNLHIEFSSELPLAFVVGAFKAVLDAMRLLFPTTRVTVDPAGVGQAFAEQLGLETSAPFTAHFPKGFEERMAVHVDQKVADLRRRAAEALQRTREATALLNLLHGLLDAGWTVIPPQSPEAASSVPQAPSARTQTPPTDQGALHGEGQTPAARVSAALRQLLQPDAGCGSGH